AVLRVGAVEDFDVGAAGEEVALGAPDQGPRVGALDFRHPRLERFERLPPEQVERRVVEHQHRDRAVALQPHRVSHLLSSPRSPKVGGAYPRSLRARSTACSRVETSPAYWA